MGLPGLILVYRAGVPRPLRSCLALLLPVKLVVPFHGSDLGVDEVVEVVEDLDRIVEARIRKL